MKRRQRWRSVLLLPSGIEAEERAITAHRHVTHPQGAEGICAGFLGNPSIVKAL